MSQQNDDIYQNLPVKEENIGYSSNEASVTMPPFLSNSSSEVEGESRANSQNDRWEPPRSSEVNRSSFRINRINMARHIERFRLSMRLTNDIWTTRTKAKKCTHGRIRRGNHTVEYIKGTRTTRQRTNQKTQTCRDV
ncbi:hypothetical protein SARC_11067 [Sphaeroforma arctica JP610]|uniref:Uncharacterized protein n=1 Tax=Sphaeroforma arctica JP610 TaxID=667725 RepID=A0A0L0FK66_9EUKA|nr:hypothetical protein SARC_11067 [Sphaeroforma arctica JP610]KNC76433.1 hypothetical protein SARC_11067 [Sphaeroforma arctica JP610]|eukprot:XP_014150335.1 hypothetical protein SARC_11067 [Sphaeroforma arctica JP610]